ncbi:hypothetical protein JZ751_028598 [Albula glossodonta]|uniref:Uncharacterized protein n=1 Tax=Albula glossodonta TaxID=121402 RepID=A0A8T2NIX0_9TELE|nr:hypothetical protein JZ751_028598 [Albula glossodonta]
MSVSPVSLPRKWATRVLCSLGIVGSTLSAMPKSLRMTAVWYSSTDTSRDSLGRDPGSLTLPFTSNASSMPSSVTPSLLSCAAATFSDRYLRTKKDSSVAMHTSSPESDQKIWGEQQTK